MSVNLELTLLGRVQVRCNGTPVVGFVSSKAQALLCYLAIKALLCYLAITGRSHSRDELAGLFWSEMPEAEAKANLRGVLFNLRQLVAPYLSINRQTIAFNRQEACWLDVARFQAGIQPGESVESEDSLRSLREAVDLYQGDLMQGFYVRDALAFEEWLLVEREHLRQRAVQGLYMLAAHYTTSGDYLEAIRYTTCLLDMDPWREEAHRQLMLLLALTGQRSAALRQYETCRQILANDLRVEPAEETTTLYHRIQEGVWGTAQHAQMDARHATARSHKAVGQAPLPFVGRGADYAWLFHQWDAARAGQGAFTVVQGEAGVGKTRLVEELLRYALGTGALVLRGRCHQFAQAVPYQPIAEVLRDVLHSAPAAFQRLARASLTEVTRLLPELHTRYPNLPPAPSDGDEAERQRLFEAVAQVLAALVDAQPSVVLFLDDLQHADAPTIDLLRYLLYRLRGTTLWCVGAYRSGEIEPGSALVSLLHDLGSKQQVALLQLDPLDAQASGQLVDWRFGLARSQRQQLVTYLSEEAKGNAFILGQLLQDLEHRSILRATNDSWQLDSMRLASERIDVPAGVQAMILERLSRLPPVARSLMDVAAVIGRRFDLHVLTLASGQHSHEVGECIELLLTRYLVRELCHAPSLHRQEDFMDGQGGNWPLAPLSSCSVQYEFTHAMIQRVIYAGLSYGYRQRLIDRLADVPDLLHHHVSLVAPREKALGMVKHTVS